MGALLGTSRITRDQSKYPLSFRPVPAKTILVGLGKIEGSPFGRPVWVQSEELVCTPVPLPERQNIAPVWIVPPPHQDAHPPTNQ